MKPIILLLLIAFSKIVYAQTTLTVDILDSKTNDLVYPVLLSIPGVISEYTITADTRVINLSAYGVTPGTELKNVTFTKTKYLSYIVKSFVVRNDNSGNYLQIHLQSSTTIPVKGALLIRGIVQADDSSLLAGVKVKVLESKSETVTDQFGYYSIRVDHKKLPTNFSSVSVIFTPSKNYKEASLSLPISKSKFDFRLDATLVHNVKIDTIKGRVDAPPSLLQNIRVLLYTKNDEIDNTTTDENGKFKLFVDTLKIPASEQLHIYLSGEGIIDTNIYFIPRDLKGILVAHISEKSEYEYRSGHSLVGSINVYPGYQDFTAYLGYLFYPTRLTSHFAVGANLGYTHFGNSFLNPTNYGVDLGYDRSFGTEYFGAVGRYYLKPYNTKKRFNLIGELSFYYGPRVGLIQPKAGIGAFINWNELIATDIQLQIVSDHFNYEKVHTNLSGEEANDLSRSHFIRPYFALYLDFIISLR